MQTTQFKNRRKQFFCEIPHGVAIIPAGSAAENRLYPNSDFIYLTGLEEFDCVALLSTARKKPQYILFWKESDEKQKIWEGARMTIKEVKEASGADRVFPLDKLTQQLAEYFTGAETLYYTLNIDQNLDRLVLQSRDSLLKQKYMPTIAPATIGELGLVMEKLRVHKEKEEIAAIRQAVDITAEAYARAMREAKPGVYEYEIEALVSYVFRRAGCLGSSFPPIVASGANATVLHYKHNNRRMAQGDLLLLDVGAKYHNYCADVTRTWPLSGKFTPPQKAVYQAVLAAQKAVIAQIKPGVEVQAFHHQAIFLLTTSLVELGLLQGKVDELIEQKAYEKFYMHKTGHFLGIDVHDLGGFFLQGNTRRFEPGMVVTVEPGLYIRPGTEGVPPQFAWIGVRIEDDILVTAEGCEVLTDKIPKEVEALEELLACGRV